MACLIKLFEERCIQRMLNFVLELLIFFIMLIEYQFYEELPEDINVYEFNPHFVESEDSSDSETEQDDDNYVYIDTTEEADSSDMNSESWGDHYSDESDQNFANQDLLSDGESNPLTDDEDGYNNPWFNHILNSEEEDGGNLTSSTDEEEVGNAYNELWGDLYFSTDEENIEDGYDNPWDEYLAVRQLGPSGCNVDDENSEDGDN